MDSTIRGWTVSKWLLFCPKVKCNSIYWAGFIITCIYIYIFLVYFLNVMVKLENIFQKKVLTLQSLTESSVDARARSGFFFPLWEFTCNPFTNTT